MKKIIFLVALSGFVFSSDIRADEAKSKPANHEGLFYSGAKVSTLGLGVEFGYYYNPYFGTRALLNWFQHRRDFHHSGVKYDAEMRLFSAGILADFHPWKSGFKMSAGLVYQHNRFAGRPKAKVPTTIAGVLFQPEILHLLKGDATFKNHTAPYIGIGYDSNHCQKKTMSWFADIGVFYHGPLRVKVRSDKPLTPGLVEAIKKHYTHELNRSSFVRWYPVISIGVRWHFAT